MKPLWRCETHGTYMQHASRPTQHEPRERCREWGRDLPFWGYAKEEAAACVIVRGLWVKGIGEPFQAIHNALSDAPTRYCKTHGVTTQFKQFDRCIQYEVDPTPCRFVWVALVELGDSE